MDLRLIPPVIATMACVALVTLVGNRTQRAVARGVSRVGLLVGALAGGAMVSLIDLGAAFLVVLAWNAWITGWLGIGSLSLLLAFVLIAAAHVWSTLALVRRQWRTETISTDGHRRR